jgi:glycosyltransferase involved in cell wall biosynthesis
MSANNSVKSYSVVIPVYNELDTWKELLARVQAVTVGDLSRQIVLVEDGSRDGTRKQLEDFAASLPAEPDPRDSIKVVFHTVNQGKGAALRTGFESADGDVVIVQDADLEYDPADYPGLFEPIIAGQADVVYGSRFFSGRPEGTYLKNYMANRFLTWLSNVTTVLKITDMETCYKVFRREVIRRVQIEQNRFGFEPEVTAKISQLRVRVIEKPIRYVGRSHEEGKKIGWKDGLKAIWCIFKYGLLKRGKGIR